MEHELEGIVVVMIFGLVVVVVVLVIGNRQDRHTGDRPQQ